MWEQIRRNRRHSVILLGLMIVILAGIGYGLGAHVAPGGGVIGLGVGLVIAGVQYLVYLTAAESVIMAGMGAVELTREASPRLFNIVEEMKLASGLSYMPRVFMIDADQPNAFALGRKPETSAIAVTSGLLYRLNRDELQGVVGHEIGHLANEDTRFMALASVLLGNIIVMSDLTVRVFYSGTRFSSRSSSRSRGGGGGGTALVAIFALLLAIIGPFLARVLYFAVSRSREYLADACSAQYTRYPEGLASALLNISMTTVGLSIASKANAPMFIVNPLSAMSESDSIFSSHPSTDSRIRVLRAMQGAGYLDYDLAFRKIRGKGILGRETMADAHHVQTRAASGEGPVMSRPETHHTSQARNGYTEVTCSCGARLRVPASYDRPTIRCIRCGAENPVPDRDSVSDGMSPDGMVPDNRPPLTFHRQSTGWESFHCDCGATVQLGPGFAGDSVRCPRCHRKILVYSPTKAGAAP